MKYLFFDTETTGLPRNYNAPVADVANWPRIVQIAWMVYDDETETSLRDYIIKPVGFVIPTDASRIHGITTERAEREGHLLEEVLAEFTTAVDRADCVVAHNISFDEKIVGAELVRKNMLNTLVAKKSICTKDVSTNFCAIPNQNGYNSFKWPRLSELHEKLFGVAFVDSHTALADVQATAKCFFELKRRGVV